MAKFQTVPHRIISKGIDKRSSPNALQPGYAEDMRNIDTNSKGFVEKRTGYQGYKGILPLRIEEVDVNAPKADLIFNEEINLLLTTSSPIVIYGEILEDGTGTIVSSGTAVTGMGTLFTSELNIGSVIYAGGESQIVTSIVDDTNLTVGAAFSPNLTSTVFTHRTTREYYWTAFENDSRKTIEAGTTDTFEVAHGVGSLQVAASVVAAPVAESLDNEVIIPEDITITDVNNLEVTLINAGPTDVDFYVLTENIDDLSVVTYRAPISEALVGDAMTLTINAATHGLPNLHVLPFLYMEKTSSEMSVVIPDSFTIDNNGDIIITVENAEGSIGGSSTFEGQIVLIDVPGDRALESSFTSGDGRTLEFTGISTDFNFYGFYDQDGSGNQIMVIPDSIYYSADDEKATATFDIDTSRNLKLVYTEASVKSNVITVDMTDYPNVIDDDTPSVSLWGIPHPDIIYQDAVPKGSWTNSFEEYSSQGENKLVVGIGGTLAAEIESGEGVTLPSYFSDMRRRTNQGKVIGPFFGTVGTKDRGIEGPNITDMKSPAESFTNNGDETVTITSDFGYRFGSLDDIVLNSSTTGYDTINVEGSGVSNYNGNFSVESVSDSATYITATSASINSLAVGSSTYISFNFVDNAAAIAFHTAYIANDNSWAFQDFNGEVFIMKIIDADLLNPGGSAAISVSLGDSVELVGDNTDFSSTSSFTFTTEKLTMVTPGTDSVTIRIDGLPNYISNETESGAMMSINSDSLVMNVLNEEGATEDLPFLVNDQVVSTLFTNEPIITGLQSDSNNPPVSIYMDNLLDNTLVPAGASINVKRTSATQPLTDVQYIVKGDTVSVNGYTREFQVKSVDITENTVTLDESIEMMDSASDRSFMSVTGRWKTIEAPPLNERPISYFDEHGINDQARLRGVSINDSIFYSNHDDEVMKYDGESIYRAGLTNWQPRTHSWVDHDDAGIPVPQFQYIAASATDLKTTLPNTLRFSSMPDLSGINEVYLVGDDGANSTQTVKIILVDEIEKLVQLDTTLVDSLDRGHILIPQQAAYYFKLQMIDRNNNLVASAVTDYQECIVDMTQSGTITHRLTGMPKFDIYDYQRVDLLMFRSKMTRNATPPFYQVKRVPIDFELAKATNSIIITDTIPDESLSPVPDDQVSIALKGAELPISSDQPPRSKYLITVDNELVLGNIKSYNRTDVTLISDSGITEENVLSNATVRVQDESLDETFEFMSFVDGAGTALDTANNIEISSIDFTTSETEFTMTLTGSVGYDLTGKFIQLSSYYMDAAGSGLYTDSGRTRVSDLGRVIGWWKIDSHAIAGNDTVVVKYTHGIDADFTFSAATNPMYMTFPDNSNSNIPVLAVPYAISAINRVITDVVYDDTTTAFEFTSAVNRGVRDLKMAFNRIMVEEVTPSAYALSGATEGNGRIVFESALPGRVLTVTVSEGGGTDLEIFVNNVRRASGTAVNGQTLVFPSRLLLSAPNFPEMFDNPFGSSSVDSDSILDINADDGQEITGLATFFGASTGFRGGQLASVLIVFKNKSVYAINTETRNIEKLESMGQGCTIPDSIAATQDGIMFANQGGIYKIDRALRIVYAGEYLERYVEDEINGSTVESSAIAITDSGNRKYKLSVPVDSDTKNSQVTVLDYVVDDRMAEGSWSIYDNIPASNWTQTNTNTYFSTYNGRVFGLRQAGDATDFRDDDAGIDASFTYGAQSFGDSGTRAVVNRVISHLRADTDLTALTLEMATDMSETYELTDPISFKGSDPKLHTIASSIPDRHGLYFQARYTHDTKDENMVLSGIDFKVRLLDELGITQAKD